MSTYRTVLLIGGSGFIGSHLAARLAETPTRRVIVPTRRLERAKHLTVLPNVRPCEADVHDDAALAQLVAGADAVINLVGVLHSRRGSSGSAYGPQFARAHVDLPRRIVAACAAHGVRRYLHMSALGADRDGPSMYLRSKADGEAAAFSRPAVDATVLRPSVVFGPGDRFPNLFAWLQRLFPILPLGGADAKFQPVYVGDVAQAFCRALGDPHTAGKVYELAGPEVFTLRELVALAGECTGHERPVIGLPPSLARMQAWTLEHLPGGPLMSRDNLDSMRRDNVAGALPGLAVLGIAPTPIEAVAPDYLCAGSRFDSLRRRR
ncbi:MAG: complex I NDUFA9 subunit family protein [Burkholderiaceae bacterium]